jgi:uncharacterized membrane protein
MSRRQFGFLVGFLIAWLLWAASFWVALGAVFSGLIGYTVARVIEGDVELGELVSRVASPRR